MKSMRDPRSSRRPSVTGVYLQLLWFLLVAACLWLLYTGLMMLIGGRGALPADGTQMWNYVRWGLAPYESSIDRSDALLFFLLNPSVFLYPFVAAALVGWAFTVTTGTPCVLYHTVLPRRPRIILGCLVLTSFILLFSFSVFGFIWWARPEMPMPAALILLFEVCTTVFWFVSPFACSWLASLPGKRKHNAKSGEHVPATVEEVPLDPSIQWPVVFAAMMIRAGGPKAATLNPRSRSFLIRFLIAAAMWGASLFLIFLVAGFWRTADGTSQSIFVRFLQAVRLGSGTPRVPEQVLRTLATAFLVVWPPVNAAWTARFRTESVTSTEKDKVLSESAMTPPAPASGRLGSGAYSAFFAGGWDELGFYSPVALVLDMSFLLYLFLKVGTPHPDFIWQGFPSLVSLRIAFSWLLFASLLPELVRRVLDWQAARRDLLSQPNQDK